MADGNTQEAQTGCRFSWNIWPPNKTEAGKIIVPIGCLYTPLKETPYLFEYDPVRCRTSDSILNPFCQVDYQSKTWACPFSGQINPFPPLYAKFISETNVPGELTAQSVEYIIPTASGGQCPTPIFLFVIDTCLVDSELQSMKEALQQTLTLMPSDSIVGLITYGTMVSIHEIGFNECPKAYIFRGNKEITTQQLQQQLGLQTARSNDPRVTQTASNNHVKRFLMPLSECDFTIDSILDDLHKDSWPISPDNRPQRCTGAALSIATSLMESLIGNNPCKIILLTGGACTVGPGKVVGVELSETLRSHLDLSKENRNAKYYKTALKYYTGISQRLVQNNHGIDIFACSLDQVGLHEMRVMCDRTGGNIILTDSFSMHVFSESLRKMLEANNVNIGYNARLEILCSKEVKICGAIGACTSLNKKSANVSESVIGEGNTNEWLIPLLDKNSTLAFYFEVVNQQPLPHNKAAYVQFKTSYMHSSGRRRLKVTTMAFRFATPQILELGPGFDQEVSTALIARLCIYKTEQEDTLDVLRWLDRTLIRLVSKFADYRPNDPNSFVLPSEFKIYPQFMYHLRRSRFLQTFGSSPDETAWHRYILNKENTMNTLVMIQPALLLYSFEEPIPKPVMLDSKSLQPNVILLLDTFFEIVIWHGDTIHNWKLAGYAEKEEHIHFKMLLDRPANDAKLIMQERFPVPKFITAHADSSQERFLKARVNPSKTHSNNAAGANANVNVFYNSNTAAGTPNNNSDGSVVITDDVPYKFFLDHLKKLAVMS